MCRPRILTLMFILAIIIISVSTCQSADDSHGVVFNGDLRWNPDLGIIIADNGISAEYLGVKITADKMQASLKTKMVVFQGNVKLENKDGAVYGQKLTYSLDSGDWILDGGRSELLPQFLSGYVISPMYVSGKQIESANGAINVSEGSFTTCDRDHPHYIINVKQMTVYPGDRIIARNTEIVMYGKRLFSLGRMVIPIKDSNVGLMPQVGSSSEEGYFLKLSYPYIATDRQTDVLKLDLMSNKGVGLGANHSYSTGTSNGIIDLYYLNDNSVDGINITGSLKHQQRMGNVNLNVASNYRQNNYLYYPQSKHRDTEITLDTSNSKTSSSLSLRRSVDSETSKSTEQALSFRHMLALSNAVNADFSVDVSSYDYTYMPTSDRELDASLDLIKQLSTYDLRLSANKRIDLDGSDYSGDDQLSVLERLPELTFETDSFRREWRGLLGLPYRFSAIAGYYKEMPNNTSKGRLLLQFDTLDRAFDISEKTQLNISGGYRQAFYDDDMAQYVLKCNSLLTTRHSEYLRSRIGWNYQHTNGYSPFRFDYTSKYNYLRTVFDYQQNSKLRLSLSTGYQFDNSAYPWQDLALRLTSYPSNRFSYSVSAGYNLNNGEWRTLINQIRLNVPQRISLELGTRYNMEDGEFDLIRGKLDLHVGSKWRMEGIAGWNGLTHDYEYKALRVTKDLHCMEAALTYTNETGFRDDDRIMFELRIKAFPSMDRFGIGQYGQMVDTSMGEYYY